MDSRRTTRTLVAGTVAGLLVAAGAAAPSASADPSAQERAQRLPTLAQVTEIYPYLSSDGKRAKEAGRDLEAPPGQDDGCDYDRVAVRAPSGRAARYGRPDDTGFVDFNSPTVKVRDFASAAAARSAYDLVRQRVTRCLGTSVRRDGTVDRTKAPLPRLGAARFAYRETGRYTDDSPYLFTHRIVVLKGDTVVITSRSLPGSSAPSPAKPLVRLTRLALSLV